MPFLIVNTVRGDFKYYASVFYLEGDEERWTLIWQGLSDNAQVFESKEHAEAWLKEIEFVQGHLTLEIVEI